MEDQKIRMLLVEDSNLDALLLQEMLEGEKSSIRLERTNSLAAALSFIGRNEIDIILLDLWLSDSEGIETFINVQDRYPDIPIVIMSSLEDIALAVEAVSYGAQDYLVKGNIDSSQLIRSIRYALERKHTERMLINSAREWRETFDAVENAICLTDSNGQILRCNEAAGKLFGKPFSGIIGHGVQEFMDKGEYAFIDHLRAMQGRQGKVRMACRDMGKLFDIDLYPILVAKERFPGAVCIITDVTVLRRAEEVLRASHDNLEREVKKRTEELRKSSKQLKYLSAQLMTAQEKERKRISRELHDELGQALTLLKIRVKSVNTRLKNSQGDLKKECDDISLYIDDVLENVRRLSRDLSPMVLDDLGLTSALNWLFDNFRKNMGMSIDCEIENLDALFSKNACLLLFRIVQEALTNIRKHAEANRIFVVVRQEAGRVTFYIRDDGKGFDAGKFKKTGVLQKGLGLAAMRERVNMLNGHFFITSKKGTGTKITFDIPMEENAKACKAI